MRHFYIGTNQLEKKIQHVNMLDSISISALSGISLVLIVELAATLIVTQGQMAYVIEAPYVHLTLAQQILHGHYGLIPGESAAPSSTILYPFLLAALSPLPLGPVLPLAIHF